MTIGEKLKRERKKQKLSLESISERTKIALIFLIALEEDDLGSLPGGIYSRNFLRAYASCLGMDEDLMTSEFHEQHRLKPVSVVHREQTTQDNRSYLKDKRRGILFILLFLIVALAMAALIWKYYYDWNEKMVGAIQPAGTQSAVGETANNIFDPILSDKENVDHEGLDHPLEDSTLDKQDNDLPNERSELTIQDPDFHSSELGENMEKRNPEPEMEEGLPDQTNNQTEQASDHLPEPSLPLITLEGLRVVNDPEGDGQGDDLNNLFIVYAKKPVWLEVYIDGVQITFRALKAGSYRVYRYGSENKILCGDLSRVILQTGDQLISTEHIEPGVPHTIVFGQGLLESSINEMQTEAQEQE